MKRIFILKVIPFIFSCYGFCQDQKEVDSLKNVLSATTDIKEKVVALDDLSELYIYSEPAIAKKYIDSIVIISKAKKYKHGMLRGEFALGHYYSTLGQMDSGAMFYRKSLKRSLDDNDDTYLATILKNLAIYEEHKGNYQDAIRLMDSSANYQLKWGDYLRYGSAMNVIGYNYYEMGNYPKAMEFYQKALRTMDTLDVKTYHKADTFLNLGYLQLIQTDYHKAIHSFIQALEVYKATNDNLYVSRTLIDIGNTYDIIKDYDKAIEFYEKAYAIAKEKEFPTMIRTSYQSLGITYKNKGNLPLAIKYLKQSIEIDITDLSKANQIIFNYNLGHAYTLNNEFGIAKNHLNKAVQLADSGKITKELWEALEFRSLLYEKNGNTRLAIHDLRRSQRIKDSLFTIEKAKNIDKLQTIYETEKKEAAIALQEEEIKTLNQEVEISNLKKGLYSGGTVGGILLSGLLFFGFRQRIKKNKIEREKQEEIYKQEIEFKKKELASQTLHLVQKNSFLTELKENLENLKNSPDKFKMEFKRLVMLLKKESSGDKDWEVFKSYFAEVHDNFDNKLKTVYPDISEKEIRLASFLKMNLSTKEIADMLNVLPDSVLKSKYRLKKKLNLDKETNLYGYLSGL